MNETEKLIYENLSGAAFGSLCSYIRKFGSPYQVNHINDIVASLVSGGTQERSTDGKARNKPKERARRDVAPNWKMLRQRAYELAGDWLWLHAVNHYRSKIAPQMQIPHVLLDMVLSVDAVKDGYGLFQILPPQEVMAKEAVHNSKTTKKTLTVRKSHRHKKRNRNYDDGNEEDVSVATNGTSSVGNATSNTLNLGYNETENLEEYFDTDSVSVSTTNTKKKQKHLAEEAKRVVAPPSIITSTHQYTGVSNMEDSTYSATYKSIPIGTFSTRKEAAIAVDFCHIIVSLLGISNHNQIMNIAAFETWKNAFRSKYSELLFHIQGRLRTSERRDSHIINDIDDSTLKQIIHTEVDIWVKFNVDPTMNMGSNPTIFAALSNSQPPHSIQQLQCIFKTIEASRYKWMSLLYYLLFLYPRSPSEYKINPNYRKLLQKICIISCRILRFILNAHKLSIVWSDYNTEEQKVIVSLISICTLSDKDNIGTVNSSLSTLLLSSTYILANLVQDINPPFPMLNYIMSVVPQLQNNEEYCSSNKAVCDQLLKDADKIIHIAQRWIVKFLKNKDMSANDNNYTVMGLDDSKSVIGELNYAQFLTFMQRNV